MISNTKNIKIKRIICNFKLVKDNHSRKDIVRINPIKNCKKLIREKNQRYETNSHDNSSHNSSIKHLFISHFRTSSLNNISFNLC